MPTKTPTFFTELKKILRFLWNLKTRTAKAIVSKEQSRRHNDYGFQVQSYNKTQITGMQSNEIEQKTQKQPHIHTPI